MVVEQPDERLACPEWLDSLEQSVQLFGGFPETAALSSDMDFISFGCKLRDEWRPADGMLPAARTAPLAAGAVFRIKQRSAERVFSVAQQYADGVQRTYSETPACDAFQRGKQGQTIASEGVILPPTVTLLAA